jgi:hypothetical protein
MDCYWKALSSHIFFETPDLSVQLSVSQFFLSDNIPHLDGRFDCPH